MKNLALLLFLITATATLCAQSAIHVTMNGLRCNGSDNGTFDALSWSFGATNTVSFDGGGGGIGAGRPKLSELAIQKQFDACSPALFEQLVTGKVIGTLVLSQVANPNLKNRAVIPEGPTGFGATAATTVTLRNAFVTNFQLSANSGDAFPAESVSFTFEAISIKDENSGQTLCWNQLTQKKC